MFNNAVQHDDLTIPTSRTDALRHVSHIEGCVITTEAPFELDYFYQHPGVLYFSRHCGKSLIHLIAHDFTNGVYLCCPNQ